MGALALSLTTAACGSSYDISDQPLAGTVGGTAWTYAEGDTNDFLSQDDDYFATLYPESFDECGFGSPSGVNHLILSIPKETGEWDLGLSLNMTFVISDGANTSDNLIGTRGTIRVDSVSDTTITGGIYAEFDGDNQIDGTFSVSICPPSS